MARIRSIKPSFFTDAKICRLSFQARLLFIAAWTIADDSDGVFDARISILKAAAFIEDAATATQVKSWLEELIRLGLVWIFHDQGVPYGVVRNWQHQLISKPAKKGCPSAPPEIPRNPQEIPGLSENPQESPGIPRLEGKGREGKGEDWKGDAAPAAPPPSSERTWHGVKATTIPILRMLDRRLRQRDPALALPEKLGERWTTALNTEMAKLPPEATPERVRFAVNWAFDDAWHADKLTSVEALIGSLRKIISGSADTWTALKDDLAFLDQEVSP